MSFNPLNLVYEEEEDRGIAGFVMTLSACTKKRR